MNDLPAIVPALGGVLVDFLWQGALIGLLAWLALALLRNARPQARYAVACAALLASVLVPAWQLLRAVTAAAGRLPEAVVARGAASPAPTAADAGARALDTFASLPAMPEGALPWIVAAWAAGAGFLALRMACGLWWVRRLRARSLPDHDGWQARVDALAHRLGLRRDVSLRIVADGDTPLSAGWWTPVVLLPAALALRMPTHLLEALLAHELAHIRRHDYLVNLLQGVVEVLLFYHPVTWWLSRRIRIEREQVADDVAATALGEPRRLAIALSQLDRYAVSYPTFAQAAHGGQLMSRIQQLVRPDRRAVNGLALLPLLGLAAAGLVFAQVGPRPGTATHGAAVAAVATATPLAPVAAIAGTGAQATAAQARRVTPATRATPATAPVSPGQATARTGMRGNRGEPGYALVRKGRDGFSMSGDMEDIAEIRATRSRIDGDFIWFRRDGKAFVVRDASLLQRAEAAWAPTQALESQMQALDARMRPHHAKMEALGKRMEALNVGNEMQSPEARAAAASMEALGERMEALGRRQEALSRRRDEASSGGAASLEQQREALGAQQEALAKEMERHARVLEAHSRRMEARARPMEALGREMEAAGRPMESIGREMEALGRQMEQKAAVADRQIRALIDEAISRGLATAAPGRG